MRKPKDNEENDELQVQHLDKARTNLSPVHPGSEAASARELWRSSLALDPLKTKVQIDLF